MVEEQKDMLEEASKVAERLENALKANEEILKKIEAIQTRNILGGKSTAGTTQAPEISKEEKLHQELKDYWKGTALEGAFK